MKTARMLVILVLALGMVAELAKADFTFGEPTNLGPTVNSSAVDFAPSFSADGLELFFCSTRPGGSGQGDIWVTTRATKEDDWGNPVNLGPTVNSSAWEAHPCVSADGLSLYFGSMRAGGSGNYDLWITTRPTKEDEWGEPVNLGSTVNSWAGEWGQSISADGLELYFSSQRSGGHGRLDLWVTTRETTNDDWGPPVNLGSTVNSSADDSFPCLSTDGLTLFFSDYLFGTSRPGGYRGADIWMTTRATKSDPWGEPVNLGPTINSSSDEASPSISADGSTLYFDCDRPGGFGGSDLWQVKILPVVDLNGDGIVDNADISKMVEHWNTDEPACDIGPTPFGDGIVDAQDMLVLTEYVMGGKVDVEADIAAIEEVLNQYAAAVNTGDFELWLSLNTDDVVKMPPDAPATIGIEELRASNKPLFDNFTLVMALFPEEAQVDRNLGFARGNYIFLLTPKAGGEPIYMEGKYLTIFKRQADGSWKISHDCFNSNLPPAQ
jgi:ketosteroid isomerase-like protein